MVPVRYIPIVILTVVIGVPLIFGVFSMYKTTGSSDVLAYFLLAAVFAVSFASACLIWKWVRATLREESVKTPLLWVGAVAVALGVGFLAGRQLPAHHYQRFGESRFLLDTATGKVCDPMKNPPTLTPNPKDPLAIFDQAQNPPPYPLCPN
jgi:hypothetical protein